MAVHAPPRAGEILHSAASFHKRPSEGQPPTCGLERPLGSTGHVRRGAFASLIASSCLVFCAIAAAQPVAQDSETRKDAVPASKQLEPARDEAELAKELQNPVANLISLPLESRLDYGPGDTTRFTLNLQPVVPFKLTEDWSVISRTIVPFIYQQAPAGEPNLGDPGQSPVSGGPKLGGIGDLTQSFFFAPKDPAAGWIWGAGPVLRLPTASRSVFGEGQWGAGPTAVALRQDGHWTYGMLANHVWSLAGWGPNSVSTTYMQPFLSYTTKSQTTFGVGSESGYDWTQGRWTVPLDVSISQLVQIGKMPVSFGLGGRLYAERPDGGPNWGVTLTMTFVFPK